MDVAASDPTDVLGAASTPLMDVGQPGAFDDNGVVFTCCLTDSPGVLRAYYAGFELGVKVRYRIFTGMATSTDGGNSFSRYSPVPMLDRSPAETLFRCGPFVMRGNDRYRMWYVAGNDWTTVNGKSLPRYRLHYVESRDGVSWPASGVMCLDFDPSTEHGIGRPWVVAMPGGGFEMYYSIRSRPKATYVLGYAQSDNGTTWRRLDHELGLGPSPGSFDSKGIMYSATIAIGGKTYCFYSGDDFGRAGFAVACLQQ